MIIAPELLNRFARRCPHHAAMPPSYDATGLLASRGVTANCVAPGFIATAMTDDLPPYQFPAVNFPKGTWELVAIAEDGAGLVTESEPVVTRVMREIPGSSVGATDRDSML